MSLAEREFAAAAAAKAGDADHFRIVRGSIATHDAALARNRGRFTDWEAARRRARAIKREAIAHLDHYLEQFEAGVTARGGRVFWAEDGAAAREYILGVAARVGARRVVKSKSMVAEEVHLAAAFAAAGVESLETDLGEYIVQLRREPPYHIVTPAMHLRREDVAELFHERLGSPPDADSPTLVAAARGALREAFESADLGVTGANFLIADPGLVALTENEGNGRLGCGLPRVHIVLTGLEKILPRLEDLALFWPLLAHSGTGQAVTCYNTLIGGPRRADEPDGPEEFHVVLLDNGRSRLLADAEQREALRCIRCGACLNACPVFRNVGGHAYATTYSGPIGAVITPHLRGLAEYGHLSQASSLCGACAEVCPVGIALPRHLLQNRRNAVERAQRGWRERAAFRIWRLAVSGPARFAACGALARGALRVLYRLGAEGTRLDPLRPWTRYRAAPMPPRRSFRRLWEEQEELSRGDDHAGA